MSKKIFGVLGCKGTTLDFILASLRSREFSIDHVFSYLPSESEKSKISNFRAEEIIKFCEKQNIPTHLMKTYSMKDAADQMTIKECHLDGLFVIGWERILPSEVLDTLKCGAFGMHGSAFGLPRGRGRSPLNWSLIQGHKIFTTSLFQYSEGIDNGNIVASRSFEISQFDDINSLHDKNRISMQRIIEENFDLISNPDFTGVSQPNKNVSFYPKRQPSDGEVDWHRSASQIHDFVRALKSPYPGAWTRLGRHTVAIEDGIPFGASFSDTQTKPGAILDVSISRNRVLVQAGMGTYSFVGQVNKSEKREFLSNMVEVGTMLESADWSKQLELIRKRYPDDISPVAYEV